MNPSTTQTIALHQIKVVSPCSVSWDGMKGDQRVRHCDTCNKNVFNLSAMSQDEAATLVAQGSTSELCVRFYRRDDGTLLTSDYSAPRAPVKRDTWRTLPGLAGIAVLALSAAACTPEGAAPDNNAVPATSTSGHWVAGGMG